MFTDNPSLRKIVRIGLLVFAIMGFISGTLPLAIISPALLSGNPMPDQFPAFAIIAVVNYSFAIVLLLVRSKFFKKDSDQRIQ
ncbi:hypothetical protein F0342_04010 [Bacillus sp. CH30_1T]|jgi:hypothetical protein|uniref:hypothetical protein n=1 Tax=Bacillus sp. CH30_1T TaxID=2604836 RepID=UPI0011EDDF8E|nr:hypothetical protein [Bacillus sp. CH30_1T]KAA0565861.1 hypothetical protein F0342_04010 [Bacillus sp. CH30_1T]